MKIQNVINNFSLLECKSNFVYFFFFIGVYTRVASYIDWINDNMKSTTSHSKTTNQYSLEKPKPQALLNSTPDYQKLSYFIIFIEIFLLI